MRELGALKRGQVWLTLGVGAIGFGGMFAVYAYLASTLTAVTGVGPEVLPWVFAMFGLGMMGGNLLGAWAADRYGMKAAGGLLLWSAAALALYPFAAPHLWAMLVVVFLIGGGGGLGSILQTRLMDVAGDAQTLAAALNHSAFNTANAIGPLLGGMAIAAGWGWTSTGWVGVALSLGGFAVWVVAWLTGRKTGQSHA
jgi:DHA1 family inner membrane transport protein